MSIVHRSMLSISKLTYLKTITAVFNVNGGVFLKFKKTVHFVKFHFYMLYISF